MASLLQKHIFSFFLELPVILYFFSRVPAGRPLSLRRRLASYVFLLSLFLLYDSRFFTSTGDAMFLRFTYRLVIYFLYVLLNKGQPLADALHFAILGTFYSSMAQSIMRSPTVLSFINRLPARTSAERDFIYAVLETLVHILVAVIIAEGIPLRKLRGFSLPQIVTISSCFLASVFLRNLTGTYFKHPEELAMGGLFTLYILLDTLFLLAFVVTFERYICASQNHMEDHLQLQANEYELRALRLQQIHENSVRAVYHDTRNHLLSLDAILEKGDVPRAREYVQDLIAEVTYGKMDVETGNLVLNSLISEKMQIARLRQIRFDCELDFRKGSFLRDVDVCAIFGNALSNALEACDKLSPESGRFIRIQGREAGSQLIFSVTNSSPAVESLQDGLPLTSKADRALHGHGLRNIRKTLEKYNGRLTIDTKKEGEFRLLMAIPLP